MYKISWIVKSESVFESLFHLESGLRGLAALKRKHVRSRATKKNEQNKIVF